MTNKRGHDGRYQDINPFNNVIANRAKMRLQEAAARVIRTRVYACPVCEFVEHAVGFDNLESKERRMFLHHLKIVHGLEP